MNGNLFPELVSERIAQIERDAARAMAPRSKGRRRMRDRVGHLLVAAGSRLQQVPSCDTAVAR